MVNRVFAQLLLAVLFFPAGYAQAGGKVFMWKAVSPKSVVYLLGSVHMADDSLYPLDPAIEKAFQESGRLAVEADVTNADQEAMTMLMMEKGFYAGEDSLEKHISPDTGRLLSEYLDANGMQVALISKMKPWTVHMTLEMLEMQKLGLDPSKGIDLHFLTQAGERRMPITELESLDYQLNLLAGLNERMQESMIVMVIKESGKMKESIEALLSAWKRGDTATMEKMVFAAAKGNSDLEAVNNKLFAERNAAMAEKIVKMAETDRAIFVVVGAGHLLGEKGVVRLLEKRGFTAAQVSSAR